MSGEIYLITCDLDLGHISDLNSILVSTFHRQILCQYEYPLSNHERGALITKFLTILSICYLDLSLQGHIGDLNNLLLFAHHRQSLCQI